MPAVLTKQLCAPGELDSSQGYHCTPDREVTRNIYIGRPLVYNAADIRRESVIIRTKPGESTY